jgi:8-oxo-dGTP pyrophosphatase MutT (NUDIX family)
MRPTPADPEAWNAYLAEGNAAQARKRVSADVLLRDEAGRILLVKPTYKPGWDLPGGMAEANEAPDDAARRELREELGLDITLHGLLVVDWVPPHGPWDDQLAFIFDGGTLTSEEAATLGPHDDELVEVSFLVADRAADLLHPRLRHRFRAAHASLRRAGPTFLRDGALAFGARPWTPEQEGITTHGQD